MDGVVFQYLLFNIILIILQKRIFGKKTKKTIFLWHFLCP